MCGDGADKAKIQELIDQAGLSDCATLAGRVDDVEGAIVNARAFALSSDFEGIPNALIEALSVGVPSVATDCSPGGAALLIKDGENGFIVPRGDAKALAEKLAILVDDKETSERFAANGPAIAEEFAEEKIADMWEDYFKRLVKGK
jgi:glycosyltransferase involved in cell wall biosynthesis